MSLRISGKHMEIGDAFRTRIEGRIGAAVEKYFGGGYSGNVTVTKSSSRFSCDCMVHLDSGAVLQAAGDAQDPVASFEAAADRIEKRLRRYKRRLKSHNAGVGNGEAIDISYAIVAPFADDEENEADLPEDFAPAIVAESSVELKTMSVASAVIELDNKESPVLVFRNAGNDHVNVVYRRPDGNIGWIDPSAARSA